MKKFSKIIKNKDCLYRYRAYDDNTIAALKNDRLYFSNPEYFNDPYDNLLFADTSKIVCTIIGNIISGMDNYLDTRKEMEMPWADFVKFIWSSEKSKEIILRERFDQILGVLDSIRVNLKRNSRIICFSDCYDSRLLWSHYANYHKGFIQVYNKANLETFKCYNDREEESNNKTRLVQVEYVDQQTDMTELVLEYIRHNIFGNMGDVEQIDAKITSTIFRTVISEKAREWSYEREWRLIPRNPQINRKSELVYLKCRPIAVIVGSQCQGEERETLIRICQERDIPVFGAYLCETSPSFDIMINDDGNMELAGSNYKLIFRE